MNTMSPSSLELPYLAFHRRDDHTTSLYTMSEENNNLIVAPNAGDTGDEILRNKTICPTGRGFLLARDPDTMATFLWCPQDAAVHLPALDGIGNDALMHSHCLLSGEPSAAGCVVLLVEGGDDNFMWYCRPGDDEQWVKHEYDIGTITLPYPYKGSMYHKIPICSIAACQGKFYFNGMDYELGVLEFCPDPVFRSITIDRYEPEDDDDYEEEEEFDDSYYESEDDDEDEEKYSAGPNQEVVVFLVESGDELYMVKLLSAMVRGGEIHRAFVQKMDFSRQRWRNVDDLGGRTFLISSMYFGASCSCSKGESGLQKDCIYFLNSLTKEMLVSNVREDTSELHKLDVAPPYDKALWLLPSPSSPWTIGHA